MDLRAITVLVVSLFVLQSRADTSSSVVFFDSNHLYIRSNPVSVSSMSTDDVAAAMSVLLGFAPQTSSWSKLNEVLVPDPFSRPRTVLVLEVPGVDQSSYASSGFGSAVIGSAKTDIELPNEDEVSVVRLDEESGVACTEKELGGIAHLFGGSYDGTESLDGELKLPLGSGGSLNLQMAKKADRQFALSLVSLVRNINRAVEIHEDFGGSTASPAELLIGRFTGIQELKEEYGPGDMAHKGEKVFQIVLTKSLELLQNTYEGKIVGVILSTSEQSEAMFGVKFPIQLSRRLEGVGPAEVAVLEVLLVRRSLAVITTVILLISTLIGVYYLINMPLTRDTLLYSNVKLD